MCTHLLFIFILGMSMQQPASLKEWLANEQWQHRVLLVYAPSEVSAELQRQRTELANNAAASRERDVIVRELFGDELPKEDRSFLQHALYVQHDDFQVLLIGKDGGVKLRRTTPIPIKELFDTIDSMPMRQDEARQRKEPSS
jgi:hypothetical protein